MRGKRLLPAVSAVLAAAVLLPGAAGAALNQWHPVDLNLASATPVAMTSLAGQPGSLYVATEEGFQRSTDGGATWAVKTTTTCFTTSMAVDPVDPTIIYLGCGSNGGVQKSTDGGATWSPADQGLTDPNATPSVNAVVVDPSTPTTVYATTGADTLGDIFVSTDSGATWSAIHNGTSATGLAINNGRLYANSGGFITSDDGGQTWSSPVAGYGQKLVADPGTSGRVYAVNASSSAGAAAVTTDGGQTWTSLATAPAHIADAAVLDGTLYLATASGIWKTADAGQTWVSTDTDAGSGPIALAVDPAAPGHIWVGFQAWYGIWEITMDGSLNPGLVPYYLAGTLPATNVTPTSATINGLVAATVPLVTGQYTFDWGTTSSYGHATPIRPFPEITQTGVESPVSEELTGLTPNTTYHVQLVGLASWTGGPGTSRPDDVTFTTLPAAPPSVTTPPAITFMPAAVPSTTLVPARVAWSVRAGTRAVCSNTLQRSIDGHTFTSVTLASRNARSFTTTFAPGHRYQFRVRASDCSGLTGDWSTGASVAIHRTASPPAATFGPRWFHTSSGAHMATVSGARATFEFTGRTVAVIGYRGLAYGRVAIALDGVRVAVVSLHGGGAALRQVIFAHSFASAGHHTLAVTVMPDAGHQAVAIDSFAAAG